MAIRSTLTELCAAFNAHDLDRIMAFFADDCVLEMPRGSHPWGSRFEGRERVRSALASRFAGLPDVHYGDDEHFVDEAANDRHVEVDPHRHHARGRPEGSPRLRLLHLPRRQGHAQGLLLEDRGVSPAVRRPATASWPAFAAPAPASALRLLLPLGPPRSRPARRPATPATPDRERAAVGSPARRSRGCGSARGAPPAARSRPRRARWPPSASAPARLAGAGPAPIPSARPQGSVIAASRRPAPSGSRIRATTSGAVLAELLTLSVRSLACHPGLRRQSHGRLSSPRFRASAQ